MWWENGGSGSKPIDPIQRASWQQHRDLRFLGKSISSLQDSGCSETDFSGKLRVAWPDCSEQNIADALALSGFEYTPPVGWSALCTALGFPEAASDPQAYDLRRSGNRAGGVLNQADDNFLHKPAKSWLDTLAEVRTRCLPVRPVLALRPLLATLPVPFLRSSGGVSVPRVAHLCPSPNRSVSHTSSPAASSTLLHLCPPPPVLLTSRLASPTSPSSRRRMTLLL